MTGNPLVNLSFLFSQPTGIATYATNLLPHLKPLNPTLLISSAMAESLLEVDGFSCHPIPDNLSPAQGSKGHLQRLLWTQFQVPSISRQEQANLFFSPIPEAPLYSKCRSVVMMHDIIPLRFPNRFSPLTPYYRYYIPQVLHQAKHILCNSQATATDIVDFFHIPASKVTPILLAYDAQHFQPPRQASMANAPSNPYFIYLGRHDPHKNLHRLISAFAALPHCKDYQLWLAGSTDGRYTPKLKAQSEELGISNQVKFLDYVDYDQLPGMLNQATALVFPSLWEGFGIPVLEAMACGTPVITSNISSLPEVAGDAAILVNPYSVEDISQAMDQVVRDEQLRSQMSQASLTKASQFSWEKTGQATVEILSNFL